jgi:exosortase
MTVMPAETQANVNPSPKLWATIGVVVLIAVRGRHALYSLAQLAWLNPEYSHILLVLPIVLAFLLIEKPGRLLDANAERKPNTLFVAAVIVWLAGVVFAAASGLSLTLQVAGVVVALWMTAGIIYGWGFFRAALFPMMFLLLLIPWPPEGVAKLTQMLQAGSTSAAYWFFKMAGIGVTRQGFVLSLPSMDIEVAKECSGIRSTVFLFVTALVLGQWYLRSPVSKALLALAVLPIGIFRNGLRIFVLSMLGTYVDEGWLEGNLHHRGGAVFFVLGLALIVWLLWYLRHRERKSLAAGPRIRPDSA